MEKIITFHYDLFVFVSFSLENVLFFNDEFFNAETRVSIALMVVQMEARRFCQHLAECLGACSLRNWRRLEWKTVPQCCVFFRKSVENPRSLTCFFCRIGKNPRFAPLTRTEPCSHSKVAAARRKVQYPLNLGRVRTKDSRTRGPIDHPLRSKRTLGIVKLTFEVN